MARRDGSNRIPIDLGASYQDTRLELLTLIAVAGSGRKSDKSDEAPEDDGKVAKDPVWGDPLWDAQLNRWVTRSVPKKGGSPGELVKVAEKVQLLDVRIGLASHLADIVKKLMPKVSAHLVVKFDPLEIDLDVVGYNARLEMERTTKPPRICHFARNMVIMNPTDELREALLATEGGPLLLPKALRRADQEPPTGNGADANGANREVPPSPPVHQLRPD